MFGGNCIKTAEAPLVGCPLPPAVGARSGLPLANDTDQSVDVDGREVAGVPYRVRDLRRQGRVQRPHTLRVASRHHVDVAEVRFDEARGQLGVDHWWTAASWRERRRFRRRGWSAVVAVRPGVILLVSGEAEDKRPHVQLWRGEPDLSDGLAVVVKNGSLAGIARVPLCSCGDRGCGNVGVQLSTELAAENLPALVETLQALPDLPHPARKGSTWHGAFKSGSPEP